MGPITAFFTALVSSAVLARPKLPELQPKRKSKDAIIAELEGQVDQLHASLAEERGLRHAAREERDRVRSAHNGLLRMFAEEQAMRLQLERDIIELGAAAVRVDTKRAQAPRHLPLPAAPLTESHAPAPAMREHPTQLRAQMEQALRDMDGFICNCAPGRHELLVGGVMLGRRLFGE